MSFQSLHDLLQDIFAEVNQNNAVPAIQDLWGRYAQRILPLAQSGQTTQHEFVALGNGIVMPKAVEALRALSLLRQRLQRDRQNGEDRPLVGRIRAEAYLRQRPEFNVARATLTGEAQQIAALTIRNSFSEYQVQGWQRVRQTIANGGSLVTIAPTGSGKTEVFLLPIIHEIAASLHMRYPKRFVLLYPRVPLLKDQIRRIFEYVSRANAPDGKPLVVGLQFTGIRSNISDTLNNRTLFNGGIFQLIDECPVCHGGQLRLLDDTSATVHRVQCDNANCRATMHLSLSKKNHSSQKPHLMVTTAELLDRFSLHPEAQFEAYLKSLTGIVVDEVHLYQSLYGAHVHNIIRRIEQMRGNAPLAKIAASATISQPQRFVSRLFGITPLSAIALHDAAAFPQQPAGVEVLFFLQSPEELNRTGALSTLIQSAMVMGHGVLSRDERALIFTDSLDMVGSIDAKVRDAEGTRSLWRWRIGTTQTTTLIGFHNIDCPRTLPILCNDIYAQGECWRVIQGGEHCFTPIPSLRTNPLTVVRVSSGERTDYRSGDMVVATSALEVGVDDPTIRSSIHYRPPIGGVFSFIQRRGRAGRSANQVAYTVMVLGNTASDQYYFFRRHRLLNTDYQLPLNPNNPTITAVHDRLMQERERMGNYVRDLGGIQAGTWRWITETLGSCPLLNQHFYSNIRALRNTNRSTGRNSLRNWIKHEKILIENYLNISLILEAIEQDCPESLIELARAARSAIEVYLSGPADADAAPVRQALITLEQELIPLRYNTDLEVSQQADGFAQKLQDFRNALHKRQMNYPTRHAESVYFFFVTLERLFENEWTLNTPIDVMRIVLQALFYLHIGLQANEDTSCSVRMDYFVPESYFHEVKPLAIEVLDYPGSDIPPRLKEGQVTELSTLLIPFKPVYRFHNDAQQDNTLSLLATTFVERSPDGGTIFIDSGASGLLRDGILEPQKVRVRPITTNPEGQQVVKICPNCRTPYNYNRSRRCCGQDLLLVKLIADPLVLRNYHVQLRERITRTLDFLQDIEGATSVLGSRVQAKTVRNTPSGYIVTQDTALQFDAVYRVPLRYSLRSTRGIAWRLGEIIPTLLADAALRNTVEAVVIDQTRKTLSVELILHTAAHLLHKAVVSIGGVNEQVLEYAFNIDQGEVVIWERTEGGTGISDIVEESIRANPSLFYRELLMAILCPVNLAERTADWQIEDELRDLLNNQYGLSQSEPLVNQIVIEAQAERHAQSLDPAMRFVCQQYDGCPACVQTTYCTARSTQALEVSRMVGEAIMGQLVYPLSREQTQEAMQYAIDEQITPPYILGGEEQQDVYNVLLL